MRPLLLAALLALPLVAAAQVLPDTTHLLPPSGITSSAAVQVQTAPPAGPAGASHEVPFASEGNRIELTVANTASRSAEGLRVKVEGVPAWVRLEPEEHLLEALGAGEEALASFSFSVDRSAPVGEAFTLGFEAQLPEGGRWAKEIHLVVAPPQEVRLLANYPNPFRERTRIAYELPQAARVRLSVYDLLGREVALLADGEQGAGHHEAQWSAGTSASGVYLCRLVVEEGQGRPTAKQQTMLLVK